MSVKHIVKRAGHTEDYDTRKLYASIYSSCLSVRVPVGEAELVADRVTGEVEKCLKGKIEITSGDIFRRALQHLRAYNQDAAYMYEHHYSIH